jgi:transcriptional regulator with XRE-family HTH domain
MATDICVRVGRRIKAIRRAKEWSQQLLADHAQIERSHLSRIEEAKREPGLRVLERIATALDVEIDELVKRS